MFRWLFLSFGLLFINLPVASAEIIRDFTAEYEISADAAVTVTETIIYDFEEEDRHGIFRTIGLNHPQPATAWYKNRSIEVEVLSVTQDDLAVPFELVERKDELEIKIGDPNKTIAGSHTYKINYRLVGSLSYGDLGSEFYWNVTGNDWPVVIQEARGVVKAEVPGILSDTNDCYQGNFGSTIKCTDIYKSENTIVFTAKNLAESEGLTLAVGINPGTVSTVINENMSYLWFVVILSVLWLIFAGYKTYQFRIANKIALPVIAQYEPYQNYLPMYTGVLIDGNLDSRDITAGILYLAEQGFIKIKKTEKKVLLIISVDDYELTLLRPVSEMPNKFLQSLSRLMFGEEDVLPKIVRLSALAHDKSKNYQIIQQLEESLKKDITASGFNTYSWPKFGNWLIFTPLIVSVILFVSDQFEILIVFLFLIVLPTVVMVIILLQARRTRKGYEVKNHLEGFKRFLSVTDKERFDFHNAPEKSPELFMEYLPYAIALGVEEKWAKVFEGITIPKPDWYDGGDMANFSALSFTRDIGVFSGTLAANSASSGTSGSSGSGFSGGGGGRGGGGSW